MTASTNEDYAAQMAAHRAARTAEVRAKIEGLYGSAVAIRYEGNDGRMADQRGRVEACEGSEEMGFLLYEVGSDGKVNERANWMPWARVATASQVLVPGLVKVGDGVTMHLWSDRHAGTVTSVSASGKSFKWTRDNATANGPTHDREQHDYSYESVPVVTGVDGWGETVTNESTARWSTKRGRFTTSKQAMSAGRHEYYDPSF